MQAQRSSLHPIPETFDLENSADQHNVDIESHIYQGEQTNLIDAPSLPDYQVAGGSSNCNFRNVGNRASGSSSFVNGWINGSGSNSDIPGDQGCTAEDKMVIGWNQLSNVHSTSRFDERQAVDANVLHSESVTVDVLNNQVMDDCLHLRSSCNYGTTSDGNPYNFAVNQTPVGNEGQSYMDFSCCPHTTQLAGPESDTFACSSVVGCMPDNSNVHANHSMDGRRGSCKRKTVESISGPSSLDVLPRSSQWDDGHLRLTAPGRQTIGSSLSISTTTATIPVVRPVEEPVIPRASAGDVGPDFRGLSMVGRAEAPHRMVRVRHNPPHQQEPSLPHMWPSGNAGRYMPDLQPNSSHSRRLFSGDQSADTGPAGVSTSAQLRQSSMFHVPPAGIQRSLHSVGWNESPMPRLGNASSSNAGARERSSSQQEEATSINMMMGIPSNTWFAAGSENRATNHESGSWVPVNRNSNGPGEIASSMLHPLPSMPWGSQHVPFTQAPRRSGGAAQGQGLASSVSRPAQGSHSQGSHFHPSRSTHSSSSSDMPVPPVTGLQLPQYVRSALLMERHGDGTVGVPFGSLQAIASEGGGQNRLMTEIRNALEIMRSRRGENLRFEDILILDQSAFYAAADIHDQHRDMRLDVDNMSYEELLDLEERIGNVSTGLSEETVCKCLKRSVYCSSIESSADEASKKQPEDELCSICREEYLDNEELGVLDCGHIHHSDCIRKWLLLKNLCPICKKTALNV